MAVSLSTVRNKHRHWKVGEAHKALAWLIHGSDGTTLMAPTYESAQQIVAVLNDLERRCS